MAACGAGVRWVKPARRGTPLFPYADPVTPAELSRTVLHSVCSALADDELRVAVPERVKVAAPRRPGRADYATNIALQLAEEARGRAGGSGPAPREIAEVLRRRLLAAPGIARVEVAGPGFLNITLDGASRARLVTTVLTRGSAYGHGDGLAGTRTHLVHADEPRAALVADVVLRAVRACGGTATAGREGSAVLATAGTPEVLRVRAPGLGADALMRRLGSDAARWALLRAAPHDAPCLDAGRLLAQRESNPLFTVRYAHARTRALLRNARDLGSRPSADEGAYGGEAEAALIVLLGEYPRVLEAAARRRAPDRIARHLEAVADAFFRFHDRCPALPIGAEKPSAAHRSRLALAEACGTVLAGGLHLLGISAPEHL